LIGVGIENEKVEELLKGLEKMINLTEKILTILEDISLNFKNVKVEESRVSFQLPPGLSRVIKELLEAQAWLNVIELSKRLDISPETTYRYLTHLHTMGFVVKRRIMSNKKCRGRHYWVNRLYQINPARYKEVERMIQS